MPYATKADVAAFMGVTEADLPQDTDRLLDRIDELLDQVTFGRLKQTTDQDLLDAGNKAACAQMEYWVEGMGESADIHGHVEGYNVGSFSMQMSGGVPKLAPRSRRILRFVGLLNQNVGRTNYGVRW